MSRLVWTPSSQRDLRRLYDFLEAKDRKAAARAMRTIHQRLGSIVKHPEMGCPTHVSVPGRRELVIHFGQSSYVALYEHNGDDITVLAIRHGREAGY
jgi:plasmid stabilization system protein ParE